METNPARLQPTGTSLPDGPSPLARGDSTSRLARRASQAGDGITPRGRRASQAQVMAASSGDKVMEAIGAALDPSYTDVEGMKELLDKAKQADMSGNISVQILEAKYEEANGADSEDSDAEESLQDRIDDALDPSFDDRVVMRQLLDEADATYFEHPMVNILRAKCHEAESQADSQQSPPSGPLPTVVSAGPTGSGSEEESEEEEEEEDDDGFDMDMELPAFKPAPKPPPAGGANRRGSIVQFGGRRMSMSVGAELQATAARLRQATATGDATQMQAALDAAAPAAMMDGPGAAEVQQLAMEIASRLSTDENLRRSVNLRRSQNVRAKVRRMWDLMVVESAAIALEAEPEASAAGYKMGADGPLEGIRSAPSGSPRGAEPAASQEGEVTKGGYKLLHMRVAKVLTAPQLYNLSEANDDAEAEWDADVARFLGTSHIMVWLDTIRTQFHTASKKAVMEHGFDALFKQYDDDGNGELDMDEFTTAVRNDLQIGVDVLPNHELRKMFYAVDADRGGSVDAQEFVTWLMAPTPDGNRMKEVKDQFRTAAEAKTQTIGWQFIFDKYDDDGSGELDVEEFTKCVREECGLSEEKTSDEDVQELFGIVDTDESGAIDATELRTFLTTNLEAASMTFAPFLASIFELTALWVPTESEAQYVRFLDVMFQNISYPCNGHTREEDPKALTKVPVIEPRVVDTRGNLVPNFRLRALDDVESMIMGDGSLDGFDANSIAGLEAAERARKKAEERREAWRREQERKRLVADEARKRREEAKKGKVKAPPKVSIDGVEMLMGFRWHDGFRWHEGVRSPDESAKRRKKKKQRKKQQQQQQQQQQKPGKTQLEPSVFDSALLGSSIVSAGGLERSTGASSGPLTSGPLQYNPATHTIRQKPRQLLPKIKDPAEVAHVAKPTVMMRKGNLEITDKKGALRVRDNGGEPRPQTAPEASRDATGGVEMAAPLGMQPEQEEGVEAAAALMATSTEEVTVKHAAAATVGRDSEVQSPSRLEGWSSDIPADSRQRSSAPTSTVARVPMPPGSAQPVGGRAATAPAGSTRSTKAAAAARGLPSAAHRQRVHKRSEQAGRAVVLAASPRGFGEYGRVSYATAGNAGPVPAAAYSSCGGSSGNIKGSSSSARAGTPPSSSSSRLPLHALSARTGTRAWSPRLMTAGANGGAGYRGFVIPPRNSTPPKAEIGYIQTLSASQRVSAAHTMLERVVGGVNLPPRAATARGRTRQPLGHHGASSMMTARPSTAGQVF
jgi:Ca2+-binding EF-hand superfamily protein